MVQSATKGKPLIESDRVHHCIRPRRKQYRNYQETEDRKSQRPGRLCRDVLRKLPRHGRRRARIPWRKLTYDIRLDGYQTDISESQVQSARAALLTCTETGTGRIGTKRELHYRYRAPYYWDE